MKRILGAIGAATVTLLAFAAPAFAWHVSGVEAEAVCVGNHQKLTVHVALSNNGPGSFVFKLDGDQIKDGNFGNVDSFQRVVNPLNESPGTHSLQVLVSWDNHEQNQSKTIEVEFPACCPDDQIVLTHVQDGQDGEQDPCPPPTTTTTEEPTTTTVAPTTTTEAPTTTVAPSSTTTALAPAIAAVPAPPAPPAPELATTGLNGPVVGGIALAGMIILGAGYAARRKALLKLGR